ncbi:high frequency lysogenization protein HflD [Pantoea sp. 1.19]|uniref:high frequency lysogenization protein HflD n=1 Tax=Pantoea sp. 1.19 TaxID=1925589 RepID=UPI000948C849|nr:high frequency lysogenization protein HflD [Pantoea sp. 1.19]
MAKNDYDITLALAGICQSAHLVQQLAHQGHCDSALLRVAYQSLIDRNPDSTLAVFGHDEHHLRFGLETLIAILHSNSRQGAGAEITRYTLSMIMLERKLSKHSQAGETLAQRITQLDRQLAHYALDSEPLIGAMASIYVDVISPLGPRIQVTGSPAVLQNSQIQSKVRATLLAGIRAAVLWKQVGGSRWQLMFSRTRLVNQAKHILANLSTPQE